MIYTEFTHPSHEHKLKQVTIPQGYKCDGCKESGFGLRYRCEECNYDLHKDCALAPPSMSHPFFGKSHFEFLEKGKPERFCDACGKDVHGFVYHCEENDYDLHPCCAKLPHVFDFEIDGVTLELHERLSSKCDACGLKRLWRDVKGWSYRTTNGEYQFHVSCVKAMVEKLAEKVECFSVEDAQKMNILSTYDGNSKVSKSLELIKPQDGAIASTSSSSRGKRISKCWKMVKTVLVLIVSLIIGDPTALLATVIVNSISK